MRVAEGLYYYGARYLDPKYSMWLSTDPALGEYIPGLDKDKNKNLPGMGGLFNQINANLFSAMGNNPIRYVDPDGRTNIYFIYTFGSNDNDMLAGEFWSQLGNFADTVLSGVSIRVIIHGTRTDIINAIQDPECYALITSGHGNDEGKICTSEDGVYFTQKDIDKSKLSKNLQLVIFENCYQGSFEKEWETAFGGGVDVVGWEGTTNTIETISFNTIGFFDRQKKNMNDYLSNIVDCIWMDRFKNFCNNLFGRNKEQNTNEDPVINSV